MTRGALLASVVMVGCLAALAGCKKPRPAEWRQRPLPDVGVSAMLPLEPTRITKDRMVHYEARYGDLTYIAASLDYSYIAGPLDEEATLTAMVNTYLSGPVSSLNKRPVTVGKTFGAELSGPVGSRVFAEIPYGGYVAMRMFALPATKRGVIWMAVGPEERSADIGNFVQSVEFLK